MVQLMAGGLVSSILTAFAILALATAFFSTNASAEVFGPQLNNLIKLECPVFTAVNATDLNATYYQAGARTCTTPSDPLVLRVDEPDGLRVFYASQACASGVHEFNGVNTTGRGNYNLTAFVGTAVKTCLMTSLSPQKISVVPETSIVFAGLAGLAALLLLGKKKKLSGTA
ncbi:hypothetical protein HY993_05045 [Candidatus Micrarchaeota archaeon]|nr:hypothetical protein [Candidatus Micrarchaeota archaeon]